MDVGGGESPSRGWGDQAKIGGRNLEDTMPLDWELRAQDNSVDNLIIYCLLGISASKAALNRISSMPYNLKYY